MNRPEQQLQLDVRARASPSSAWPREIISSRFLRDHFYNLLARELGRAVMGPHPERVTADGSAHSLRTLECHAFSQVVAKLGQPLVGACSNKLAGLNCA